MLRDRLGRTIDNLRVSVTDKCNFRCMYCMPEEGLEWLPKSSVMTFEEIVRFVRIVARLGIRKIRLTGGEPLLRRGLPKLVRLLREVDGVEDIAMTTNGIALTADAGALYRAGLDRVNVSIDSLVREVFQRLVRRDALEQVLSGLRAAKEHFRRPIKVNTVVLRRINDQEIESFAELARAENFSVRFIEFMPLDADQIWSRDVLVPGDEVLQRIHARYPLEAAPDTSPHVPARDYVFRDGVGGRVGFINSVTEPFCDQCNRIRITADGKLRTCLFSIAETDILALLRGGASDGDIARVVERAVLDKEPGHKINHKDFVRSPRTMSQIGG